MQRFRFPLAVAVTALALVAVLVGAGGLLVGSALANGPLSGGFSGGPWTSVSGHPGWQGSSLPPELAGLASVPAGERFAHFQGVRVQLTDKDNKPLTVDVTPGTATSVTPTSLTLAGNDGASHTFSLNDKTILHTGSAAIAQNDKVVVVALNNSTTATAVVAVNEDGFGPHGPFGAR